MLPTKFLGSVLKIENGEIIIRILKGSLDVNVNNTYDILFEMNRTSYQIQHKALDAFEEHKLFKLFIDNTKFNATTTTDTSLFETFNAHDPVLKNLNPEQLNAIKNIVCKANTTLPYILYGPPGTGKTRTLVAAISYIVRNTSDKILVCAMSNQACNEVAERLMDQVSHDKILRLFAKSYSIEKVNEKVTTISNRNDLAFEIPTLKCIYDYQVVICTLCTSSILLRAQKNDLWKPDHFKYVMIDEIGCTLETMAIVPIAGISQIYYVYFLLFRITNDFFLLNLLRFSNEEE